MFVCLFDCLLVGCQQNYTETTKTPSTSIDSQSLQRKYLCNILVEIITVKKIAATTSVKHIIYKYRGRTEVA